MEFNNWFSREFPSQSSSRSAALQIPTENQSSGPSSSSSSLRSPSTDSPEYSSLLHSIPNLAYYSSPSELPLMAELVIRPPAPPVSVAAGAAIPTATPAADQDQGITPQLHIINRLKENHLFPGHLANHQLIFPPPNLNQEESNYTAFESYRAPVVSQMKPNVLSSFRQSMIKRGIAYYRNLNLRRMNEDQCLQYGRRPTSATQLHHVLSERKRREKLKENFQALRSLLPPGSKKDKASVLTTTKEYLTALKSQVAKLIQRNQFLESKLLISLEQARTAEEEAAATAAYSGENDERFSTVDESFNNVYLTDVPIASTSENARFIDLKVSVRRDDDCNSSAALFDVSARILELLKLQAPNTMSLISMDARTRPVLAGSTAAVNRVVLRLKIEGAEWDKDAFQEAVKRVISDLVHVRGEEI